MLKLFASAVMVGSLMVGAAYAQQTANLSSAVPGTGVVYEPCKAVSENPETADAKAGICVTAAKGYLSSLTGADPAVADQALADAVAAIAPLAVGDGVCNEFDDEIAAAVRVLSTRSSDTEQIAQLEEIAATIESCQDAATAAILSDQDFASRG